MLILTQCRIIKLKTSYREYCPLDTKTLLPYIILDINRQQQQEERKRKNISPRPTSLSTNTTTVSLVSSRSSSTTASNSYNSSMPQSLRGNNFINLSERRVSNPVISPFKSPSLSASPQPELTCNTENHATHLFIFSFDFFFYENRLTDT